MYRIAQTLVEIVILLMAYPLLKMALNPLLDRQAVAVLKQGHIIPKKAFSSSDAAKQFYNQARSYHEKSQVS